MKYSGYISEHDYKIASKLAFVLAGGRVAFGSEVDEEYLLDLEREHFKPCWRSEVSRTYAAHVS